MKKLKLNAIIREDQHGFEVLHCGVDHKHCEALFEVFKHCAQPRGRIVRRVVLCVESVEEQILETALQFPEERKR